MLLILRQMAGTASQTFGRVRRTYTEAGGAGSRASGLGLNLAFSCPLAEDFPSRTIGSLFLLQGFSWLETRLYCSFGRGFPQRCCLSICPLVEGFP